MSPLSNSYLTSDQIRGAEQFFPLRAMVCGQCYLVQLQEYESPEEIFSEYAYFSSYSTTWLDHCERFAKDIIVRRMLGPDSTVIEIASNDGYLLQFFQRAGVQVLGIEPAKNIATEALGKGIPTLIDFFGKQTATNLIEHHRADLLIGNNVLAHVPDLNDFVAGLKVLLSPDGLITMEFPHLLRLLTEVQFDTIYHEHFSYFSYMTVGNVFAAHGLQIFDVEELPTHGGSLRIYATHSANAPAETARGQALREQESAAGCHELSTYLDFSSKVHAEKRRILSFFIAAKQAGKKIAGYGAPAKGNTLLNFCGLGTDFIDFTVDRNPYKQGRFLPGTHIPIFSPDAIREYRPDLIFILPWNLRQEIVEELEYIREWGGRFVVRVPELTVYE